MKTLRVISIIGIILFSLSIIGLGSCDTDLPDSTNKINTLSGVDVANFQDEIDTSIGLGVLACIYGLVLSIVGVVSSKTKKNSATDVQLRLLRFGQLRDKGILSEDEFEALKRELLAY